MFKQPKMTLTADPAIEAYLATHNTDETLDFLEYLMGFWKHINVAKNELGFITDPDFFHLNANGQRLLFVTYRNPNKQSEVMFSPVKYYNCPGNMIVTPLYKCFSIEQTSLEATPIQTLQDAKEQIIMWCHNHGMEVSK